MFKFLRKYNKWILAVGGTLLMIVFLIPQAIQSLSQRAATRGASWATIDGDKVSVGELAQAQAELQLLHRIGASVVGMGTVDSAIKDPAQWYLLVREAEQAGVVAGRSYTPPEQLDGIARLASQDRTFADRTIARLNGVNMMLALYANAGKFSDRRLQEYGSRLFHGVRGYVVVIEASADDVDRTPTEAEIQAQFDKYADVLPFAGDPTIPGVADELEGSGFGYKLRDRVKLEWLTIDEQSVRSVVEASEKMSRKEIIKHWMRDEDSLFPPHEAGKEIPDEVRADLLDLLTAKLLDDIAKYAHDQLRAQRRALPEADGYLELPEDWATRRAEFQALAEGIRGRFSIDLPAYEAIGDRWLELNEVAALPGVGSSLTDKFGRPTALREVLAAAKEFGGSAAARVQQGVALPPMRSASTGADGSLYVVRVTDSDPSRAPQSIEDAREAIIEDLKKLEDYRSLVDSMATIEEQAETEGLLATAMAYKTNVSRATTISLYDPFILNFQLQQKLSLTPIVSSLPVIGAHEPTIEKIIAAASALPEDAELTPEHATIVVPVEEHLCLVIVEIADQLPLTVDRYQTFASSGFLHQFLLQQEEEGGPTLAEAFSFEALSARHKFERGQDDDDPTTKQPDAEESTARVDG